MTDSDKWEAASGNIRNNRGKLLQPGGRRESIAENFGERGLSRDARGRARWPGRAWTQLQASGGRDPGSGHPGPRARTTFSSDGPAAGARAPQKGAGSRAGALTCSALRPSAGQQRQLKPQEQGEGERGKARHPGGGRRLSPFPWGPRRGLGRARDGPASPAPPRAVRALGAGLAPLGSWSRRSCARSRGAARTEKLGWAGAGRGGGGRCPRSPNAAAAAAVARRGAPPWQHTHPRAHARAWHTPAAATRGLPRAPSAGLAGSGPLAQSRAYTHPPRTHKPHRVLASSRRATQLSIVCPAWAQVPGKVREEGEREQPFELEWENR